MKTITGVCLCLISNRVFVLGCEGNKMLPIYAILQEDLNKCSTV